MSIIDELITDRTQADVDRAAYLRDGYNAGTLAVDELAEWDNKDLKGRYNASDLNRVGEACAYLHETFIRFGYEVSGYTELRKDWAAADVPTINEMQTYIATITALRSVFESAIEMPKTMSGLTIEGANNIERVLVECEWMIEHMVYALHRSAEFSVYSGMQFIPTANDDFGRTWKELDAMQTTWRNWQVANWYLLLYGNLKNEGDVE